MWQSLIILMGFELLQTFKHTETLTIFTAGYWHTFIEQKIIFYILYSHFKTGFAISFQNFCEQIYCLFLPQSRKVLPVKTLYKIPVEFRCFYLKSTFLFLGAFAKLGKATITFLISVSQSVCPSAWNNSAYTERILLVLDIWVFFFPKSSLQS
jgi:hypothetical protein